MPAVKRCDLTVQRSWPAAVIAACATAIGLPLLVAAAPAAAANQAAANAAHVTTARRDGHAETGPAAAPLAAQQLAAQRETAQRETAQRQRELTARQGSGSIIGVVQGADGLPLTGACVTAIGSGRSVTTGTNPAGRFDIPGLPAGGYVVEYRDCAAPARYLTRFSGGTAWQRTAAPVRVEAGRVSHVPTMTLRPLNPAAMLPGPASWQRALARADQTLSAAAAAKTGSISGVVTGKGRRLRGICVEAAQTSTGPGPVAEYGATTGKNGAYTIHGLPAGSYYIEFEPFNLCANTANWLEQNYRGHNELFFIPGNVVKVASGKTVRGIDGSLTKGGQVSGTVKTRSGRGLPGVCVTFAGQIAGTEFGLTTPTGKGGSYAMHGVFPGTYTLSFMGGCGLNGNYAPAFPAPFRIRRTDHRTVNVRLVPGAVLAGTVRFGSSTGQLLQGICVVASNESGTIFEGTSTGPAGNYRLQSLGTGAYTVSFDPGCGNNGNYVVKTLSAHATDGKVTSVDAILQQGAEIRGTVTNSAGTGLGGICIELAGPGSPYVPSFTTGDGSYTISQMAAGTYELGFETGCGATGNYAPWYYDDQGDPNLASPISVAAASVQTIDARMQTGGEISGTVTDGHGKKLSGACAELIESPDPDIAILANVVFTNRSGRFAVSGLEPGLYYIVFGCGSTRYGNQWFDGGSGAPAALVSVAAGKTSGISEVLRPAGTISGVVTSKSGRPLPGICVGAVNTRGSVIVQALGGGEATTSSRGRYQIQPLPAGVYDVDFFPCGSNSRYALQWYRGTPVQTSATPVKVRAGVATAGIDARLATGGTISGRVVGSSGKPLGNICVQAYNAVKGLYGSATTGKTGAYIIPGVSTASYTVEFSPCNADVNLVAVLKHANVVAPRTTAGVDATLAPGGSVSGVVTTAGPTPVQVSNECVEVISANPNNPGGSTGSGSADGFGGGYLITGLAPGTYTVYFGAPDCSTGPPDLTPQWYDDTSAQAAAATITVTAGQTTTGIDAALQTTGEITGTVHGPQRALVSGACVTAFPTVVGLAPIVAVTRSGGYTLTDLQPGAYRVKFSAGCGATGYRTQWWRGAGSASKATVITVPEAQVVSGISATLGR